MDRMVLIECAAYGQGDCLDILLKAGADVNALGDHAETVLIRAATSGSVDCVKLLLAAGADVNASLGSDTAYTKLGDRTFVGQTALSMAAHYILNVYDLWGTEGSDEDRLKCLKILLKSGAHIDKVNLDGQNALTFKLCETSPEEMLKPVHKEITMVLFAAGETINGKIPNDLPDYLQQVTELNLCLKDMCRITIRKRLVNVHPHQNLFHVVPQLGLPSLVAEYLLYDMSIEDN